MSEITGQDLATAHLVTPPPRPNGVSEREWAENLSEPADYGGEGPDRSREQAVPGPDGAVLFRFREILLQTQDLDWVDKSLAGLSHKALWRNEETGASIALIRFAKGSGIPQPHYHSSNQFMICLSGKYEYTSTGVVLTAGSFYCNPKGNVHGPAIAHEDTVVIEVYDGPHYPEKPSWYTDERDAR